MDPTTIEVTRGDAINITVTAKTDVRAVYTFEAGVTVRLKVMTEGNMNDVVLQKDMTPDTDCTSIQFTLTGADTRIGVPVSHPRTFWYEVSIDPEGSNSETIIGYDGAGPKKLIIYPEGGDLA